MTINWACTDLNDILDMLDERYNISDKQKLIIWNYIKPGKNYCERIEAFYEITENLICR